MTPHDMNTRDYDRCLDLVSWYSYSLIRRYRLFCRRLDTCLHSYYSVYIAIIGMKIRSLVLDDVSTFPFRSSSLHKKITEHKTLLSYIIWGDFEPGQVGLTA